MRQWMAPGRPDNDQTGNAERQRCKLDQRAQGCGQAQFVSGWIEVVQQQNVFCAIAGM